jgi:GTPase Era involved in 16S rRNA processing
MQDEFSKVLPADLLQNCSAVRPPADRVTCLLIGNHSAGKSSFVNFYVGEEIQSTSVAMETAGITVVRSGKKRVEWRGRQTASAFPHLERVVALPGVLEHIETQFSTSSARDFRMVEFIDTPGLVDGTVKYPFDVDAAVDALAEHAAVVLVFLDPIGKALVARTMRAVQRLSEKHLAKMHFVLAKFDTIASQTDRTNVVAQVLPSH